MAFSDIEYRELQPPAPLGAFVESFWMLVNHAEEEQNMVLIPDSRIDVFFSHSATEPYQQPISGPASRHWPLRAANAPARFGRSS